MLCRLLRVIHEAVRREDPWYSGITSGMTAHVREPRCPNSLCRAHAELVFVSIAALLVDLFDVHRVRLPDQRTWPDHSSIIPPPARLYMARGPTRGRISTILAIFLGLGYIWGGQGHLTGDEVDDVVQNFHKTFSHYLDSLRIVRHEVLKHTTVTDVLHSVSVDFWRGRHRCRAGLVICKSSKARLYRRDYHVWGRSVRAVRAA